MSSASAFESESPDPQRSPSQVRLQRQPPAVASRTTAVSTCITVIGVAVAAAYASTRASDKGIGIAAWVAVSVVGASAVISAVNTVDHFRADHNRAVQQQGDDRETYSDGWRRPAVTVTVRQA